MMCCSDFGVLNKLNSKRFFMKKMKFTLNSVIALAFASLLLLINCRKTTVAPSSDANLKSLSVSATNGGTNLLTDFITTKESYDITLPSGTANIFVSATTTNNGATIAFSPTVATDGSITIPPSNTVLVKITAQDKKTIKTYTINFSFAINQSQAVLSSLVVNLVKGDGNNLIPNFNPANERYALEVLLATPKIFVLGVAPFGGTVTYSPARDADDYITIPNNGVVKVTVTQPSKTQKEYTITITKVAVRTANDIVSFIFAKANNGNNLTNDYTGKVGTKTVTFDNFPASIDITALIPTIEVSGGATVSPESGIKANFTTPVTYTVTAEDKMSTKVYTVTITKATGTGNTESDILSFNLEAANNGVLDQDYIGEVRGKEVIFDALPFGTNISALKPTIEVSKGATVIPASGAETDFTSPQTYTVTAENGSTSSYTVTVTRVGGNQAMVEVTSTSDKIFINTDDGFLIAKNKDLKVKISSSNTQFLANPIGGLKLTAVDDKGAVISPLDVELDITRVNDKELSVTIKAKSNNGTTSLPVGSKLKITVEGTALADASGYTSPQSIELTLTKGIIWDRRAHLSCVIDKDGDILVVGGVQKTDVWKSRDNGLTWELVIDDAPWGKRSRSGVVIDSNGQLYVIGGYTFVGDVVDLANDVWRSNPQGDTWDKLSTTGTTLTSNGFVVSVIDKNDNIYSLSGWSKFQGPLCEQGPAIRDVFRFGTSQSEWTRLNERGVLAWPARYLHSAVIDSQNSVYVIGGGNLNIRFTSSNYNSGNDILGDVWKSNPDGTIWTNLMAEGFVARKGHSSVIDDENNIYVMGGIGVNGAIDGLLNDVLTSSDGQTWTEQNPNAPWSKRYGHSSLIDKKGNMYIMGGFTTVCLDDVWRSTDKGKTWERLW